MSHFLACCTFGHTLGATDFSCVDSGFGQSRDMKYFCHRRWKSVARNIVHGCSGVTYTYISIYNFWLQIAVRKAKVTCSVEMQTGSSLVELKGHEYVAKAVTLGVTTCFCISGFSRIWRSIMAICNLIIWHGNSIQIRSTQVVLVASSYYCCRSSLLRNRNVVYELWFLPVIFQKHCQEKIRWICHDKVTRERHVSITREPTRWKSKLVPRLLFPNQVGGKGFWPAGRLPHLFSAIS